ncbi:MAG: 4Fe-4S binding protein [Dehalococcoidia bacterium]|jgi:NAD-dependent dihydropyrimidine dehydrogenase PreA subunit
MFYIESDKCTGCGVCVNICPQKAITLKDDIAVIDQMLCGKCGDCARACPSGAIKSRAPVYAETIKGGDTMRGRGFNSGRGSGFGFRGSSPPWPYVGRGRGGLPRCQYPGLTGGAGYAPYVPQLGAEQELSSLKEEASAVKQRLADIEARIKELEAD